MAEEEGGRVNDHGQRESFFQEGRDYESRYVNHMYLNHETKELQNFESLDYFSSHSTVYKEWVRQQPARFEWDRWITMGIIGFCVGMTAFVMHQGIKLLGDLMKDTAQRQLDVGDVVGGWFIFTGIAVLFVLVSSFIVVMFCPEASGSGLPELIAYLNGTNVRRIFAFKTYLIKFVSCLLAVASGLPAGPEGPMIAIGGLIGASVSQFKSTLLNVDIPLFRRLRNSEDRRNFLTAGAGAGVSAAFGAPMGGLLFAMEEVSSFWNDKLSWQTFFCCMVSAFTADLFNSAFDKFEYTGNFGLFQKENYIIFHVEKLIPLNLLVFIPAVLLGFFGGVLGALFTFVNLKIARLRKLLQSKLDERLCLLKFVKICEPVTIMLIMACFKVLVPTAFNCQESMCFKKNVDKCLGREDFHTETSVEYFTCKKDTMRNDNEDVFNGTFNPFATVFFSSGEEGIHHLFSRGTHEELGALPLGVALALYFPMACWTAGSSVASGLVVPMLMIGALYGRLLGRVAVYLFGVHTESWWGWLDPGAFALIGAASFFGGVSRLTMSLTVILMEMTNDIQFLLPIMVSVMIAKWVGDLLTHSFYHATLEIKCIPFLDNEPFITENKKPISLELFTAADAMVSPVKSVRRRERVSVLTDMLTKTSHCGFPVVNDADQLVGSISRQTLAVVLENYHDKGSVDDIPYELFLLRDETFRQKSLLDKIASNQDDVIDLSDYINQSAVNVPGSFSLHRAYVLFRTLGLRHLFVTNEANEVVGVITRMDLMGHFLERRLLPRKDEDPIVTMSQVEVSTSA